MRIRCPHCKSKATIRTSKEISEITREASLQCSNIECAHTWVMVISAVRTIAPSMTPDPKVHIPISPRAIAAKALSAQGELPMDHPPPRMAAVPTG